ncbi:MAG: glutamine-hydrolyzing carbamoyl-phosphate synthase small subunit [Cyclobacteriaceae bacterium]|jgi:carbamoyl-phosphate synthase small subunit|uniref:Carbamoyl phosphate synthase small chain n=1 Tax=Algoriphagus marincola TaxID=264027 RepID=A0ABS7N7J6_9BACT|nr:glutamine-hydrolyzing carbamoyl-phosphate synthase small subunit [Algoriphagus marincola]MBY5952297.1 glutamine-hydrolyzing carbamoyl-phosphate synthase small subunit [Algoriphagus marincola]MCR9081385.1 glutamine-hydrolyzing carbamoyl-phosphate synthase small subunit [Cyclobacteriaceae bacterium]
MIKKKATLLLADGTIFHGSLIGNPGTNGGEICFNTGMTGYQEIYTDPSYTGQVIVTTTSHIGNYGVHNEEVESDHPTIGGIVVNSFSEIYSRLDGHGSLQDYLVSNSITGIADIDTRKLVRHIRSQGAMNAIISSEYEGDLEGLKAELEKLPDMNGLELSSQVCTKEPYFFGNEDAPIRVACLDFGIKKNILRNLASRGVYCKVFPAKTSLAEMETWAPDAYFLSNGPGDPAAMDYAVETVKDVLATNKPVFGICLGHQLLAEAVGISTFKMHHGHRGINHPIKNLFTGKSEITSQNHGFNIVREDAEKHAEVEITHVHLNDNTVAGIKLNNKPAFSVQYHPESSPGPHDSRYLFDDFIALINKN